MPTAVELSLSSLLPTISPLPDELTTLATSLLAQSRTKAAALKPEEEIGRTYACCHIACQRLGHRLALEIAKPTPPVKPKVYSKLHTYLNSVLKTTITPRRARATPSQTLATPSSSAKTARGALEARSLPTRSSPVEKRAVTAAATPTSRKRKANTQGNVHDEKYGLDANDTAADLLDDQSMDPEDNGEDSDDVRRTIASIKRPAKTPLRRKEKHGAIDEDDLGAAGLLPGLRTMFQPAVDWLSEDKRADYARWKKSILREAALIEQYG